MTISIIPLSAVPAQDFRILLGAQRCRLQVYERRLHESEESHRIYMNLYINDVLNAAGMPCLNSTPVIPDDYYGFVGNMTFFDLQGKENPKSSGLGSRWILTYNDQ